MTETKKFGDNLAMYMHATHNKITPYKLSSETGIDYKKVRRMMANVELPDATEFKAIIKVFGNKPTDWTRGMSEDDARAFMAHTTSPSENKAPAEKKPEETATEPQEEAIPDRRKCSYHLSEEDTEELIRLRGRYERHEISYRRLLLEFNASPKSMVEFRKAIGWTKSGETVDRMKKELREPHKVQENAAQKAEAIGEILSDAQAQKLYKMLRDSNKTKVRGLIFDLFTKQI